MGMFSSILGAGLDMFGQIDSNRQAGNARDYIREQGTFNPKDLGGAFGQSSFGEDGNGTFTETPQMQAIRASMGQGANQFLQGGQFNNQQFQDAFNNNNMQGAFTGAQGALGQNMNSGQFATQGMAGGLMGMGMGNLMNAGNQQGLMDQRLANTTAMAQQGENQLVNRFNNQEFMKTRGATTGAGERQQGLQNQLLQANNARVQDAQNFGQQQSNFLSQLGGQQMGMGFNENQSNFMRQLQGLQQNQSAGNQRLQNSMSLFGLGADTQQSAFNTGVGGQTGLLNQNQFGRDTLLQGMNSENSRMNASQGFASLMNSNLTNSANSNQDFFGNMASVLPI